MSHVNNLGTDMYRISGIAEIPHLARRYMADVDDCMPQFGRKIEDVWKNANERHRRRHKH